MKNHREELRYQKDYEKNRRKNSISSESCDDLDGGSNEMAEEAWNSGKEKK